MRRAILGVAIVAFTAGCRVSSPATSTFDSSGAIRVVRSPSSYAEVTAGAVQAFIPDGWRPVADVDGAREGFFASPAPGAWQRMDGSTEGMAASWVDASEVGVPSDFYYLAATGPLLSRLTHSADCRANRQQVYVDNSPSFVSGDASSPGDYMASGDGSCRLRGRVTRWAYFVAAPGFGPVRRVGIPRSGLYMIVAVAQAGRHADALLRRLIDRTRFGGADIGDFVRALRTRRLPSA